MFCFPYNNPVRWILAVLSGLLWYGASRADAQVSPNMPLDDPVYRDLRFLEASGLLDSSMIVSRPLTRLEIARLIARAEKKQQALDPGIERPLLSRLQAQYGLSRTSNTWGALHGWWGTVRLRTVEVSYLGVREPTRLVPRTNARTTPFLHNREGRRYHQDDNSSVEAGGDWQLGSVAVISGQGRWYKHLGSGNSGDVQLLSLYITTRFFGPFVLQFGRDNLAWGNGFSGQLGISRNAKAFDMIRLNTPNPVRAPWIFRHLGPVKSSIFITHMGKNRQDFKRPRLFGTRLDMAPFRSLRIGFYRWLQFGGKGAPSTSLSALAGDFFGIRPGNTINTRSINNGTGLDFQWRPPFRHGLLLSTDLYWEDVGRVPKLTFIPNPLGQTDRALGFTIGALMADLMRHDRLGLQAEYTWIPGVAYRHGLFRSGFTYDQTLIGHDLGPAGQSAAIQLSSQVNRRLRGVLRMVLERRGQDGPQAETRVRLRPYTTWDIDAHTQVFARGGYEWVRNFDFVPGDSQGNSLVELGMRINF